MRNEIQDYHKIAELLKMDYKLSDFEALSLAVQIERNQLLENGLMVSRDDSRPTALEAITMALGGTGERGSFTVTEVLSKLVDKE